VARSEPVTRKMWVGMASVSSHEPSELIRSPAHSSRKSRIRSAWSTIATHPLTILTE